MQAGGEATFGFQRLNLALPVVKVLPAQAAGKFDVGAVAVVLRHTRDERVGAAFAAQCNFGAAQQAAFFRLGIRLGETVQPYVQMQRRGFARICPVDMAFDEGAGKLQTTGQAQVASVQIDAGGGVAGGAGEVGSEFQPPVQPLLENVKVRQFGGVQRDFQVIPGAPPTPCGVQFAAAQRKLHGAVIECFAVNAQLAFAAQGAACKGAGLKAEIGGEHGRVLQGALRLKIQIEVGGGRAGDELGGIDGFERALRAKAGVVGVVFAVQMKLCLAGGKLHAGALRGGRALRFDASGKRGGGQGGIQRLRVQVRQRDVGLHETGAVGIRLPAEAACNRAVATQQDAQIIQTHGFGGEHQRGGERFQRQLLFVQRARGGVVERQCAGQLPRLLGRDFGLAQLQVGIQTRGRRAGAKVRGVDFLRLHMRLHQRHGQRGIDGGVKLHAGGFIDRGGQLQGQGVQRAFGIQPRGERVGFALFGTGQCAGERAVRRGGVGLGGGVGGGFQRQLPVNGDDGGSECFDAVLASVAAGAGGEFAHQRGFFAACPVLQGNFANMQPLKLQGNRQGDFRQRQRFGARRCFFFAGGAGEGDARGFQRLDVYAASKQGRQAPDKHGRLDGDMHLLVRHVDAFGAKTAGQRALRLDGFDHRRCQRQRVIQAGLRAQQPEKHRAQQHKQHRQCEQNALPQAAAGGRGGGGSGSRGGSGHGRSQARNWASSAPGSGARMKVSPIRKLWTPISRNCAMSSRAPMPDSATGRRSAGMRANSARLRCKSTAKVLRLRLLTPISGVLSDSARSSSSSS